MLLNATLVQISAARTAPNFVWFKVWNADTTTLLRTLSGHSSSVTCVRWTGNNFLVSSSQDKTMKVDAHRPSLHALSPTTTYSPSAHVWDPETGVMVRSLDMYVAPFPLCVIVTL